MIRCASGSVRVYALGDVEDAVLALLSAATLAHVGQEVAHVLAREAADGPVVPTRVPASEHAAIAVERARLDLHLMPGQPLLTHGCPSGRGLLGRDVGAVLDGVQVVALERPTDHDDEVIDGEIVEDNRELPPSIYESDDRLPSLLHDPPAHERPGPRLR